MVPVRSAAAFKQSLYLESCAWTWPGYAALNKSAKVLERTLCGGAGTR